MLCRRDIDGGQSMASAETAGTIAAHAKNAKISEGSLGLTAAVRGTDAEGHFGPVASVASPLPNTLRFDMGRLCPKFLFICREVARGRLDVCCSAT